MSDDDDFAPSKVRSCATPVVALATAKRNGAASSRRDSLARPTPIGVRKQGKKSVGKVKAHPTPIQPKVKAIESTISAAKESVDVSHEPENEQAEAPSKDQTPHESGCKRPNEKGHTSGDIKSRRISSPAKVWKWAGAIPHTFVSMNWHWLERTITRVINKVLDMQNTQGQCGCCNDAIVRIYMSGHLTGHTCPDMMNECCARVHTAAIHAAHILRGSIFGPAPA
jgi:hypothetical protein